MVGWVNACIQVGLLVLGAVRSDRGDNVGAH